jgi:ribonuclease Z
MVHHFKEAFKVDTKVRSEARIENEQQWNLEGQRIVAYDIDEGFVYEEDGAKVIPFRVNHHGEYSSVPSLGYRIEYAGKCVVISGDTCFSENLIKYSQNVDLLIHEVAAGPLGLELREVFQVALVHHTSPEECGKVFSLVNPGLAVYYHVIQFEGVSLDEVLERTRREYGGALIVGEDLMEIEIGDTVRVLNR